MTTTDLINKYQEIWDKFNDTRINESTKVEASNLLDRGFSFQFDEDVSNPDVLFIGINPVYREDRRVLKEAYSKPANKPGYFRPFYKLEEDIKKDFERAISWTHIDLLAIRETQQSFVDNYLFKTERGVEFVNAQLAVAKELIEYIKPKVIVASNTLARELLGRNKKTIADGREVGVWMDYKFEFDKVLGTDKIVSEDNLNGTPVFFTAMLSGQKALDRGTFQRLAWHIDSVLSKGK